MMSINRSLPLVLVVILLTSAQFVMFPKAESGTYRDYDAFINAFKDLADDHQSLMSYQTVGKTVEDRNIIMFTIGNPDGGRVFFDGAIHGEESLAGEILYSYAKWLVTSNASLANRILARTCTLVIPAVDADEYNVVRTNVHHVDLNRNFATNWQYGSSTDPNSWYYRGPNPLSEPESRTIASIFQTYEPSFYVNVHRGGSVLYEDSHGNSTYYSLLSKKMNDLSYSLNVTPYPHTTISGNGFAMTDAAVAGITSFLFEVADWTTNPTLSQIDTLLLPRFIPVAAVLSQECENSGLFRDGFESGDFTAWSGLVTTSGENASILNVNSSRGEYEARFEASALGGLGRACVYKTIDETSSAYARAYFYIAEGLPLVGPDDHFTLIQFVDSHENPIISLQVRRIHNEDRFALLSSSGDLATTSAVEPQDGRWYCLELLTQVIDGEATFRAYVNDTEVLSFSNLNATGLGNVHFVRFGLANNINNVQHRVEVHVDDAMISTSRTGTVSPAESDINRDGVVDLYDALILATAFGSRPTDHNWNSAADINRDDVVDLSDAIILSSNYVKIK